MNKIEIDGDNFRIVADRAGMRESLSIQTVDFLTALYEPNRLMLSGSIRAYNKLSQTVLFERPPEVRNIFYREDMYELQLPWLIFYISLKNNSSMLFASPKSITSFDDTVYHPYLPNVNSSCGVCLGHADDHLYRNINVRPNDIQERLGAILNVFWQGTGNDDYTPEGPNRPTFIPEDISRVTWRETFKYWEENVSLEDVLQWRAVSKNTLQEHLRGAFSTQAHLNTLAIENDVRRTMLNNLNSIQYHIEHRVDRI